MDRLKDKAEQKRRQEPIDLESIFDKSYTELGGA